MFSINCALIVQIPVTETKVIYLNIQVVHLRLNSVIN